MPRPAGTRAPSRIAALTTDPRAHEASDGKDAAPLRFPGLVLPRAQETLARDVARHARFVGAMKVVLPLIAVALVALLVSWPYMTDREDAGFRLSYAAVEEGANGTITMTNARYIGTDEDGQPFTISAESAEQNPDDPGRIAMTGLSADIALGDGPWLALQADRGVYQQDAATVDLAGDVRLFSDTGYELHTEAASVDLKGKVAEGHAPVSGQGPAGLLEAGGFRADAASRKVRFFAPVRMTLYPSQAG